MMHAARTRRPSTLDTLDTLDTHQSSICVNCAKDGRLRARRDTLASKSRAIWCHFASRFDSLNSDGRNQPADTSGRHAVNLTPCGLDGRLSIHQGQTRGKNGPFSNPDYNIFYNIGHQEACLMLNGGNPSE